MNFPEIRPEDVVNWLFGVGYPMPGAYIVAYAIFGVFIVIAVFGGVRYSKNVERKNERARAARAEAERIAAEQADSTQHYDQPPGPYRD
jgi:hypothetical protein